MKAAAFESDNPHSPSIVWKVCRATARLVAAVGWQLKVHGRQHIPARGGVLLVSNHQSYLDPIMVGAYLQRPMCYLAKSELFTNRWFSWLLQSLYAFPIRQGAGDVGAVREMLRRLEQGWMLNIFAEGSRSEDGEIGPIEPGAALVLRRAGVPCVPAVIEGSFAAWPKARKLPRHGMIDVMFGPAMQLEGLRGEQITRLIDCTLREMLERLRAQRGCRQERTLR
jgi:1-acyl-sn-glycerol-3-phosphate acyltransferase